MMEQPTDIQELIRLLNLQPLPNEGGLFRQVYCSQDRIAGEALPERYPRKEKPFGTAILYLLTSDPDSFSAFHRLPTDETWHFYLGDPLEMTLLYPDGSSRQVILGQDLFNGQHVQYTVPRGVWQGTRLRAGGRFALAGTTMAPGFTDEDYEAEGAAGLLAVYPHERERILALCRQP